MASSSLQQSALSFPSEAYVSLPRSPPVSLSPSLSLFFSFLFFLSLSPPSSESEGPRSVREGVA